MSESAGDDFAAHAVQELHVLEEVWAEDGSASPGEGVFCREKHEEPVRMLVVQSAAQVHDGHRIVWRRKRCPKCGAIYKTVEVPIEAAQRLFETKFKKMY